MKIESDKTAALAAILLLAVSGILAGLALVLTRSGEEKALWLRQIPQSRMEQAGYTRDAEGTLLLALEKTPFDTSLWQQTARFYDQTGRPARADEAREILRLLPPAPAAEQNSGEKHRQSAEKPPGQNGSPRPAETP